MKLEYISCYNCNSQNSLPYDQENGFELVKCGQCGLLYVNPRPLIKEIADQVKQGMHVGDEKIKSTGRYSKSRVAHYKNKIRDFFSKEELMKKDQTWLDVGCGFGEFIEALNLISSNQLLIVGSEPNIHKIKSASQRNLNVSFIDLSHHNVKYDFISMLNVYSHLPNPMNFIKQLRNMLKPNGVLLLETGNTSHIDSKDQVGPYYLPNHLSFCNQDIMEEMLTKLDFEIEKVKLYRSPVYPRVYEFKTIAKTMIKMIFGKTRSFRHFAPKNPNTDMYIKCRLNGQGY